MENQKVYVKDSSIHGKGLFAKKSIRAGSIIGEITGKPAKNNGPYVLWLDDDDKAIEVQNIFKYINHNSRPNACYYDDLTVVALRDIKKDEEITHHYGDMWDEDE